MIRRRKWKSIHVKLFPSKLLQSQEELNVDMAPGYTEVIIEMNEGGEPNQTLWIDAVEFGPVAR